MKPEEIKKIRSSIEKEMDSKRFEHTLGVAYTAATLAMCHDFDPQIAHLAGLLHDCAKCYSEEKTIRICQQNNIAISDIEAQNVYLLHGKVGAVIAAENFGIRDNDILNAIRYHTTGRPNMSLLEKIIYIADYIEPGRKKIPKLDEIRKAAYRNLDEALLFILDNTLKHLNSTNKATDPLTSKTYEFYRNRSDYHDERTHQRNG